MASQSMPAEVRFPRVPAEASAPVAPNMSTAANMSTAPNMSTPRNLGDGLWFVPMSAQWAARLDIDAGFSPGQPIVGFEVLTAGVIAFAERLSTTCVIGFIERTYGLEVIDCAVAWADGRIVAGPSGTAVTADNQISAATEILDALGIDSARHASVLTALADG